MPCFHISLPSGGHALVRVAGAAKCCLCERPSEFLCDFLVAPGRTCSRRLCRHHRADIGNRIDFCPEHQQRWLDGEQRHVFPVQEPDPTQNELF